MASAAISPLPSPPPDAGEDQDGGPAPSTPPHTTAIMVSPPGRRGSPSTTPRTPRRWANSLGCGAEPPMTMNRSCWLESASTPRSASASPASEAIASGSPSSSTTSPPAGPSRTSSTTTRTWKKQTSWPASLTGLKCPANATWTSRRRRLLETEARRKPGFCPRPSRPHPRASHHTPRARGNLCPCPCTRGKVRKGATCPHTPRRQGPLKPPPVR